jgi:osmoprotectant transport system permease protein
MTTIVDDRRPAASHVAIVNPVLFSLVAAAVLGAAFLGFVDVAPNRLLSGRPVPLWAAADAVETAGIALLGVLLVVAALVKPARGLHWAAAATAAALFFLLLAATGGAAQALSRGAPPAARISFGAGFWIIAAAALLAIVDALQRVGTSPAMRLLTALLVWAGTYLIARSGRLDALSLAREYHGKEGAFAAAVGRHMVLVAESIAPAIVIGCPLGIGAARHPAMRGPLFAVLNLLQTVPSIALFGLLIAPLSALAKAFPAFAALGIGGIGVAPAVIALVLYALLPIARNTAAGLAGVDPAVVDAARGTGLTAQQIFWQVEVPLASPVLIAGLRIVTVQTIGLAVVAALIGAGGLGSFVFDGLGQYAVDLVLLGALPAIFLALAADFLLQTAAAMLRRRYPR